MQLAQFEIAQMTMDLLAGFDYPARSRRAVVSCERLIDPDILFQEIEGENAICTPMALVGCIR
jgi:hypothetical protein